MESPESTGIYRCPDCGNTERFTGEDNRAYPGADCTCGAYWSSYADECTCEVTLRQDFDVQQGGPEGLVDIDYHLHSGGYDAEINTYTRIECRDCGAVVWKEDHAPVQ